MNFGALSKDELYVVLGIRRIYDAPGEKTWNVCIAFNLEDANRVAQVCREQAVEFTKRFPKWTFAKLDDETSAVHQFWIDMFDPFFIPVRDGLGTIEYVIHAIHQDPGTRRNKINQLRAIGRTVSVNKGEIHSFVSYGWISTLDRSSG